MELASFRVAVSAAAGVSLLLAGQKLDAAELRWSGPESCAERESVVEQVGELLGRPLASVRGVDFEVKISHEEANDEWRLHIETIEQNAGDRRTRELSGKTCSEVTGAAAVAITMAIRASDDDSLGQNLADYAGNWEGYAEAYEFNSGSDRVHVTLDANGLGRFDVGNVPPWPPRDPNRGYPDPHYVVAGLSYTIVDAHVDASRIRFSIDGHDIIRPWCEQQTPILDDSNPLEPKYRCTHSWHFEPLGDNTCEMVSPDGTQRELVDCSKIEICGLECVCTATSCTAAAEPIGQLDAALEADGRLVGTLIESSQRLTVRLTRQ
jgi:hypothetical protein